MNFLLKLWAPPVVMVAVVMAMSYPDKPEGFLFFVGGVAALWLLAACPITFWYLIVRLTTRAVSDGLRGRSISIGSNEPTRSDDSEGGGAHPGSILGL